MQQLSDGTLVLAATDLTNHLACAHLTQERIQIATGTRSKPKPADDPHGDLVRERGEVHEREQLDRLSALAGGHTDLSHFPTYNADGVEAAASATLAAMEEGAALIYQAQLYSGRWQGKADFLRRTARPSSLGDYSYEVIDTKLARHVKPQTVHQLSLYSRMLADVQDLEAEFAYVILGDGLEERIALKNYAALHRHTTRRLESIVDGPLQPTYPEPVAHCDICALSSECYQRRLADDHLSLVAGARRSWREDLVEGGLETLTALATASEDYPVIGLAGPRFALLHHQAALQLKSRVTSKPTHRHREPLAAHGYAAVPTPSAGDIFFDLEGDPYVGESGIEYLWGWCSASGEYEYLWAHDPEGERSAFERFIDYVVEQRALYPDLHVYHYAAHERAKLGSLSVEYGTREEEVDVLLREGVLVDLYAVVRHGIQVGEDSYSLKKLERHHAFERLEHSVREGGGSIIAYETWLETGENDLLESVRAYNEEDCRSTLSLRDWLREKMRPEAAAQFGVDFDDLEEPEEEGTHGPPEWLAEVEELIGRLTSELPADASEDSVHEAERRLIAHLLLYHRREGKPEWWRYFELGKMTVEELIDERDAIGGLERDFSVPPVPVKQSLVYAFTFPAQEFRLGLDNLRDPTTGAGQAVTEISDTHVFIRRGKNADPPAPAALSAGAPPDPKPLRNSLIALAESILTDDGRFSAARRLLRREPPTIVCEGIGETAEELSVAALALDDSTLPIQGPPGTGKTYRGARMVVAALRAGKRVGICAQSHAAIQNMLHDVEEHAAEVDRSFNGVYKGDGYESKHDLIEVVSENKGVRDDHELVAGTAWLFSREELREKLDVLFIDEAGQFAVANAAAIGLATKSMVLLGDPQQLPQVTQAEHARGSGASVLEHVLDGAATIPSNRGVLLTETWRMHPDVCEFISERSYEGRLRSRAACSARTIDAANGVLTGTGLRAAPIEHEGRSQASPEEADAIAAMCRDLLAGATVTNALGQIRTLRAKDIMVVAPYNLAVRTIHEQVPDGVAVGTVDRFQGQQAAVVFYAMTCSSGEDAPRGIDFLFDSHRLNVAISRAQCLAVLVHNPALLDADCKTVEAMELVDGVCRFVEMAEALSLLPPGAH